MYQKVKEYFNLRKFRKQWRKSNLNNKTTVQRIFPIDKVSVGRNTYGELCVYSWGSSEEKLVIGSYCSIASFVEIMLGGNHNYSVLSTYPFHVWILGTNVEAQSKGSIVIDDDVWIGQSSMIMSGVHIGQGAIVGARSVVTKNIPPYAIVGGNPARVIKFRFSDDIIKILIKIDFSQLDSNFFVKNQHLLEKDMSIEVANEIFHAYKKLVTIKH